MTTEVPRLSLIRQAEENALKEAEKRIDRERIKLRLLPEIWDECLSLLDHPTTDLYRDGRDLEVHIGGVSITISERQGDESHNLRIQVKIQHLGQTLVVRKHDEELDTWLEVEGDEKHQGYHRYPSVQEIKGYLEAVDEIRNRLSSSAEAGTSSTR